MTFRSKKRGLRQLERSTRHSALPKDQNRLEFDRGSTKTINCSFKVNFVPRVFHLPTQKGAREESVANSHVDSVTPLRSMILSCQRSPYLVNIQLRRLLHRESRGLQFTSATSLYNKQRKHKDSVVKD